MSATAAIATDVRVLSHRQALFIGYFFCVLVDLTVLNLFDEYFEPVNIDSFTTSLFAAALLQLLLRLALALEHRIANYFKKKGQKLHRKTIVSNLVGLVWLKVCDSGGDKHRIWRQSSVWKRDRLHHCCRRSDSCRTDHQPDLFAPGQ